MKNRILKCLYFTAATLCLLFMTAFVSGAALAGDVSGDGLVTADDARTILRVSVALDHLTEDKLLIADINDDGKVTAADARDALRISVNLETVKHYYLKEITLEPTCTETGTLIKTCTECDEAPITVTLEALGHDIAVEVLEQVTCDKDGLEKHTCSRCEWTEEVVVPLGHIWDKATSTCTEDQYCTRGNHIGEAKKGHTQPWGKCERCNIFNTEKYASQAQVIKTKISEATTELNAGYAYIQESVGAASWLQQKAVVAKPRYLAAKAAYQEAYNACADIAEFSTIKQYLTTAIANTDKIITALDAIIAVKYVDSSNYVSLVANIDTPQWANERINNNLNKAILW